MKSSLNCSIICGLVYLEVFELLLQDPFLCEGLGDALADGATGPAVRDLGEGAEIELRVGNVPARGQNQLLPQ